MPPTTSPNRAAPAGAGPPVTAMAVTPDGTGAWLLRSDGSVIVKG